MTMAGSMRTCIPLRRASPDTTPAQNGPISTAIGTMARRPARDVDSYRLSTGPRRTRGDRSEDQRDHAHAGGHLRADGNSGRHGAAHGDPQRRLRRRDRCRRRGRRDRDRPGHHGPRRRSGALGRHSVDDLVRNVGPSRRRDTRCGVLPAAHPAARTLSRRAPRGLSGARDPRHRGAGADAHAQPQRSSGALGRRDDSARPG
jgi:hypothetical protein